MTAMGIGSIVGALLGGFAVAYILVAFLKLFLGAVLVAAALKTIASHRQLHYTDQLALKGSSQHRVAGIESIPCTKRADAPMQDWLPYFVGVG